MCSHLDELRELLDDDGSDPSMPLTKLVVALQGSKATQSSGQAPSGRDLAALLDEVHAAVQAAGDAVGVYGFGRTRGRGLSGMDVLQIVYRCPLHRCAGRPAGEVEGPRPVCTVSPARLPLIRERL